MNMFADSAPSMELCATTKVQTMRERMEYRKNALEAQLAAVNEAIKLLDENPTFEKIHNAIAKAGY